ncbi:alpha/beta fold hydrolase [Burkholderia cenocepacia]|uniref:alpha/beta fold hydrolase n=1 Tax=Burkholderia cenocepacia TaxID=95486 RepID=UPI001EF27953|nr:alpha/beta fold hydrolase [Burkholderia cenocepacia]
MQNEPSMSGMPAPGLPAGFDRRFSRRYAQIDDVRLHYVTGGPDDGELVVLLHGWPQTWYTWRHVMPVLAQEGYRVVAVDYRGAGESDKPLGGYDKAAMAGDIRALVSGLPDASVARFLHGARVGPLKAAAVTRRASGRQRARWFGRSRMVLRVRCDSAASPASVAARSTARP